MKSTLAAECLSLQEASECSYDLKTILEELLNVGANDRRIKIHCLTDNRSLVDANHFTKH